jgi:hypothetical protein
MRLSKSETNRLEFRWAFVSLSSEYENAEYCQSAALFSVEQGLLWLLNSCLRSEKFL